MNAAAPTRPPRGRHAAPRSVHGRTLPLAIAAFSAAAAAVHAAVIREHFAEYWLFGAFFVAAAALQAAWAWLILARPSRRLYLVGAWGQAAVVLLWLVSRTIGLPLGPEAGVEVAMAVPDVIATVCEALAALGALAVLRRTPDEPPAVVTGSSAGVLAAGLGAIALFAFLFGPGGRPEEPAAAPVSGGGHVVHFVIIGVAAGLFLILAVADWVRNGPRKPTWRLKDERQAPETSTGTPSRPSR